MIGEIGGNAEEDAADFIKKSKIKKYGCLYSRLTAPKGKGMGRLVP